MTPETRCTYPSVNPRPLADAPPAGVDGFVAGGGPIRGANGRINSWYCFRNRSRREDGLRLWVAIPELQRSDVVTQNRQMFGCGLV
jgi:hypothetical protein